MSSSTMTVAELAEQAGVQPATVKRHIEILKRQGAYQDENGTIVLPYGTRYPYFPKFRSDKPTTAELQFYTILKATSEHRFVDAKTIRALPEEFDTMLRVLVEAKLLQPTGVDNPYGANAYICTMQAVDLLTQRTTKAVKQIASIVLPVLPQLGLSAMASWIKGVIGG